MTELQRLLDGGSDELALALLRSADEDSPSDDSLKATAVVLGIGTTLGGSALLASGMKSAAGSGAGGALSQTTLAASPALATAASITFGAVAKQVVFGLVSGLFAMGGLQLALDHSSSSKPAAATEQPSVSPARTTPELRARGRAGSALPEALEPSSPAEQANSSAQPSTNNGLVPHAVRRRVAAPSLAENFVEPAHAAGSEIGAAAAPVEPQPAADAAKPQTVALNKSLAAEVALLDRARSALRAQNASGALRALDQYRKERQTAILDPEATVLQIQVLEKLGEHGAAVRLARQFVTSHPESRHVESLRVLAAEAP
jgi:hypothetical protein